MSLPVLPGDPAGQDVSDARHAPALRLDRIQEHLLDAFYAGRSANTVRAYRRDHEDFRTFVARQDGLAAFAATAEQAVRMLLAVEHGQANALALGYRTDMVRRQLQPATVNRRLAALRSVVRLGNTPGLVSWTLDAENVDSVGGGPQAAALHPHQERGRPGRAAGGAEGGRDHPRRRHRGRGRCLLCEAFGYFTGLLLNPAAA